MMMTMMRRRMRRMVMIILMMMIMMMLMKMEEEEEEDHHHHLYHTTYLCISVDSRTQDVVADLCLEVVPRALGAPISWHRAVALARAHARSRATSLAAG